MKMIETTWVIGAASRLARSFLGIGLGPLGWCAALMFMPKDRLPAASFDTLEQAKPTPAPYNLILISLTNTRADHLGVYGYSRNTSPNIDQFARKCLVFKNAFSHASWTLPVSVSLFTSQYPFTHGLLNREDYTPLPPETPTFVDVLNTAGYTTAAFVGNRDYNRKFGHTSRFSQT